MIKENYLLNLVGNTLLFEINISLK